MAFTEKLIDVIVSLGRGSFGESGANSVMLSGFGVSAQIEKVLSPDMDTALIRVYGLSRSLMNQLSQIGLTAYAYRNNVVSVMAGDAESGKALVFSGLITYAWPDFQAAPNVAFVIEAKTGMLAQVKPVDPISYQGTADIADIMQALANQMGLAFENNGVHVFVDNPYHGGTARQQAIEVAKAADCYLYFEDDSVQQTAQSPGSQGKLIILPKDGARGTPVPIVAPPPQGGMVGYPTYAGPSTIVVKTLLDPRIRFLGNVEIQGSVIQQANGQWRVTQLGHSLEAGYPEARDWFTHFTGWSMLRPAGQ